MRNIQNIDISLKEIVKNIENSNYLIPKFQRDFVWNTKDVTDLGDSIIRGYPISSLLTMPEHGTLKVGSKIVMDEFNDTNSVEREDKARSYILDGQQRVISISKLFLSYDNKNEYYFDLLAILVEEFPDDKIDGNQSIKDKFARTKKEETFCRHFPIGKDRDNKPTRNSNRFISGKSIIGDKFGSIINKFLRSFGGFESEAIDKYTDHLNAVLGSIGGYNIPATVIAGDSELGVVIRVFEKVNSTGIKLKLFDLINAKSFETQTAAYEGGLSNYLKKEIIAKIEGNNDLKSGVDEFLGFNQNEEIFEKIDRVIRIFEVASLLEKNATPSIFQSTMLKRDADFWFNKWIEKGDSLLKVISWMDGEGLFDIGQVTFLEYASAIFLSNEKSFDSLEFKKVIKRYAVWLTLTGGGFSKSNLDIVEKLHTISKRLTTNANLEGHGEYADPIGKLSLTKDKILEATTSKSIFKAIRNICYKDKIGGKFTVDIMGNQIKNAEPSMDNHHIYPKSKVSNFSTKGKFNSIANIVLIDAILNRVEIKDKKPSEYFGVIDKQDQQDQSEFNCKQNLIDMNDAKRIDSEEDASRFIDKRSEEIAKLINTHF